MIRRRVRGAWLLCAAALPAQDPQGAVRVWCHVGEDARSQVAPILDAQAGGAAWVWAADRAAADVWLAVPLADLWAAARQDLLAHRGAWDGVPADAVEPAGRFAVRFRERWGLAWDPAHVTEPPRSVEDLLWSPRFDQAVALATARAAPELWESWRQTLGAAYGESKAQAWLTRLDGRVGTYAEDLAGLLPRLRAGEVGFLPEDEARRAGLAWALPTDGAPRRSLGVALVANARPGSAALLDRFVAAEADLAVAMACSRIAAGTASTERGELAPEQGDAIDRWWRASVRGRGAELESLDRWLDVVLGIGLAVVLFGIYRSIRRAEAAS